MAEATKRLSKVASEFNISIARIVEFLQKKGFKTDNNPNTKLSPEMYDILVKEFQVEKNVKEAATKITIDISKRETISLEGSKSRKEVAKTGISLKEEEPHEELIIKSTKPVKEQEVKLTTKQFTEIENKTKEIEKIKEKDKVILSKISKKIDKEEKAESFTTEEKDRKTVKKKAEEKIDVKIKGKIKLEEIEQKNKPSRKSKKEEVEEKHVKGKKTSKKQKGTEIKKIEKSPEPEEVRKSEKISTKDKSTEKLQQQDESVIAGDIHKPEEVSDESFITETKEVISKEEEIPENFIKTEYMKLEGPVILGKMDLPIIKEVSKKDKKEERKAKKEERRVEKEKLKLKLKEKFKEAREAEKDAKLIKQEAKAITEGPQEVKKKRKRLDKKVRLTDASVTHDKYPRFRDKERRFGKQHERVQASEEDIEKQIKETLARLSSAGKSKSSKHRKLKRELISKQKEEELQKVEEEKKILKVTEFVTANELATMMNVPVNEIISMCMNLGIFISINQRLDAETLAIVAEELGYKVEFVSADVIEAIKEEEDKPEDRIERPPIVTVMGHVDHGKTSLLDYIRKTNVIAGEAGGITQHIGAYEVTLENGKKITFLDTPGHEAFTAMRARGTKVTDVAIIVVAADEDIMPQTIEAINHASAASVPMVFAINKIDKPNANIDKIKEGLAKINYLVEDWGGKYQCQEISAKKGENVEMLLDKVLLEAELLELKANPNKKAYGTIIESSLDKGKGYVAKLLVQDGTLNIGDIIVAGYCFGKVKAMYNERNTVIKEAGPSTPLLLLGLNGAPQAGDTFNVFTNEHEAKEIATKRLQLQREQSLRTQKHITLDEIGRRIAIGDFKQLNIIVKGDVDGSVEALSDSLLKLSTEQVQVNVIHKSVGQITESDILLASASDAVIIGFQVRPSPAARKLAAQEQIDIRLYSIIYNAINELKSAIEGMLSPEIVEKTTSNLEVKEVFKITKFGTVAGCYVMDGKLLKTTKVHLIRDGIVVYTGEIASLKHFKDDAKEVRAGMECGLSIKNFNDIKVADIIEGFEEIEVQRKL